MGVIALVVFGLASVVAAWAAYDGHAALMRLALLGGSHAMAQAHASVVRRGGTRALALAGMGCALLVGAIAAFFLLSHDWRIGATADLTVLDRVGLWLQARRPALPLYTVYGRGDPAPPVREDVNANVAGAAIAILAPLGCIGVAWAYANGRRLLGAVAATSVGLALFALLLTSSRGAWVGLAAGVLAATYLRWSERVPGARRPGAAVLFAAGALLMLGVFVLAVVKPGTQGDVGPLDRLLAIGGTASRTVLWRDMLDLVADYRFTGSGLGSTMMVYSSYMLLIHVGYLTHAHNLFLQVAVEQGLIALAAFLALLIAAFGALLSPAGFRAYAGRSTAAGAPGAAAQRHTVGAARLAAVAALVALVVHGMADAGLYASRLAPVVFLPFGFALGLGWLAAAPSATEAPSRGPRVAPRSAAGGWGVPVAALAAGMALVVALLPPVRAAFQENLGAVAQTRAELGVYVWPDWPIQDALRRDAGVDLAPAIARFQAALALDPADAAANRRLGQIELSRGDYSSALAHLESAFRAAPGQSATRRLLGEAYAIAGDPERAAALWRTVDLNPSYLDGRIWWYDHLGEAAHVAALRQAAALAAATPSAP